MRRRLSRALLALVVALSLAVVAALARAPQPASANSYGVSATGCSHAQNWCGITVWAEWGGTTVTGVLYGRDGNGYYWTKTVSVYPYPTSPRQISFWVGANDTTDILTISAGGTITSYYGPYVGL